MIIIDQQTNVFDYYWSTKTKIEFYEKISSSVLDEEA